MKRNNITLIGSTLFVIGTIALITLLMFTDSQYVMNFAFGYIVYTILFLVYILLTIILNSRHLKWVELRKKSLNFFIMLVIFSGVNFLVDYLLRPANINYSREISIAFATALGISSFDLLFYKKSKG